MEGILSELRAGGDFEQLVLLYNEDTAINSASVCFAWFMPENYYQAAVSLPRYGISDVIVLTTQSASLTVFLLTIHISTTTMIQLD